MYSNLKWGAAFTVMAAASLAACTDSDRTYRVASVGSAGAAQSADGSDGGSDAGSGSGTGSSGSGSGSAGGSASAGGTGAGAGVGAGGNAGTNLIVASGNVLIGAASKYGSLSSALNGTVPGSGLANGKVVAVLNTSGHSLVRLGNGTGVLLNSTGGKIGDLVSIDFGKGQVVGGSSPLVGVNVLAANPTSGSLATVSAASGTNLVGVTVVNPGANSNSLVLAPQVAPLLNLQPSSPNVTTNVTATASGTVSGAIKPLCC